MNFSVHLPDPLLTQLDQFAAANSKSRSSIVREAVSDYLATRTANAWPEDLAQWMNEAVGKPSRKSTKPTNDWPDFDDIRSESNASAAKRTASL
jgi:predicted transcriptional regulator